MDINEVKERLLQLGYTVKESDNMALLFCINRVEEHIKNICNVGNVPEELYYKIIDMSCGEFLNSKLAIGELDGYAVEDNRLIKSITEGDTTVTYADGADRYTALKNFVSKLSAADSELYSFRKMRW